MPLCFEKNMSTYINDKTSHITFYVWVWVFIANEEHVSVCICASVHTHVHVHTVICMENNECMHTLKFSRKVYALSYCIPVILWESYSLRESAIISHLSFRHWKKLFHSFALCLTCPRCKNESANKCFSLSRSYWLNSWFSGCLPTTSSMNFKKNLKSSCQISFGFN